MVSGADCSLPGRLPAVLRGATPRKAATAEENRQCFVCPPPRVSPALMSHVDTAVPVPHILFPFLASLAPHSIGLGREFCMCLRVLSHFAFEKIPNT